MEGLTADKFIDDHFKTLNSKIDNKDFSWKRWLPNDPVYESVECFLNTRTKLSIWVFPKETITNEVCVFRSAIMEQDDEIKGHCWRIDNINYKSLIGVNSEFIPIKKK
ncbi:MAG: hypothetical protein OXC02_11645 [Rhodobacteraceae bacterium]|nr:hypothetical protein [Paracoccaceae bacterium]